MIKQIIPEQVCLRCQGCCRFSQSDTIWAPSFLAEELGTLEKKNIPASAVGADKKLILKRQEKSDTYICPFFDLKEQKCNIYALRPFECQLYPFLINRQKEKVFLALDLNCPFAKDNLEAGFFKKYAQYLARFLNTPGWLKLLKNNPQIIQSYAGANNLSEIKL